MAGSMDLCDKVFTFSFMFSEPIIKYFKEYVNFKNRSYKNISLRQFRILYLLKYNEKLTVSEIADSFFISKSSLSITISRMVNDGLIEKTPPSKGQDGRKVYIVLTEKGEEIIDEIYDDIKNAVNASLGKISSSDFKKLEKGLDLLNSIEYKA